MRMLRIVLATLAVTVALGCGSAHTVETAGSGAATVTQRYPDVVDVEVSWHPGGYTFAVTISSPYDSPQRHADAFRVRSPDGDTVYGVRELRHPHGGDAPFTRSLTGVNLPAGATVVVEAHDSRNGWGGATVTVRTPPKR